MATLKLDKVIKRFGKTEVVHGLDLDIHDKEFLVLVGPSGCGKSTLLRMIAGLEEISDGTISINDKVVNDVAPKDRGLAMVFQNYALYPHMDVFGNMSFGLSLAKTPKNEIRTRVEEVAEILGLKDLLYRKPHELSGGQRQRVAMGRAMVRKPAIFLFDEPLSNLDAKLRIQMRAEIKLLHQRVDSTIIYVTHDQIEAMTLADRLVVLKDGYIEQVGTPLELFSEPVNTFVASFIGTPPMNLSNATVEIVDSVYRVIIDGGLSIPLPLSKCYSSLSHGQKVAVGLRAEEITPCFDNAEEDELFYTEGSIILSEPLGSETHLHMNVQGMKCLGKSEVKQLFHAGDKLKLALNLAELHLFDAESTKRITA